MLAGAIVSAAPDQVAGAVGAAQRALITVADSLAAHLGDWGATSRVLESNVEDARAPAESAPLGPADSTRPSGVFARDIRPLFRSKDRDSMRFAFDLWSFEDVSEHADDIRRRVDEGTMPCDGAWTAEQVETFSRWIDAGKPE